MQFCQLNFWRGSPSALLVHAAAAEKSLESARNAGRQGSGSMHGPLFLHFWELKPAPTTHCMHAH